MKQGWTYKKLGEVAQVQNGFAFDSKLFNEAGKGTPLIRIRDIKRGYSYTYTTENCDKDFYIEDGALLVGMDGDFNVCTWKGGHSYLNQRVCHIIPSKLIVSRFLYYLLPYPLQKINDKTSFSTVKHLSSKQVNAIMVPVPPLDEQQRIVSRLDSAFAHIDELKANAEKQVNEARALFQKALSKAMEPKEGWEEKTLKETAKYRRGSFPQPYGNKEWYDGEGSMPFIQVAELQEDSFNVIPVTKRRISKIAQPLSVFVPAGTVLVSLQGSIGKVAITNYDSYVDRTIAIFQDYKININKKFFAFQLKIRFEIERLKARGTTIKTITKEEFANFIIYCPSLSEQQRIVERLDALSENVKALEENQRKVMAECDALKQALLRKVFE